MHNIARSDFGTINGWNNNRGMITNGTLRMTLEKNALVGERGLILLITISNDTAYELDSDSQFEWSRAGA